VRHIEAIAPLTRDSASSNEARYPRADTTGLGGNCAFNICRNTRFVWVKTVVLEQQMSITSSPCETRQNDG